MHDPLSPQDYSPAALQAYRSWLRARQPALAQLNSRWGSAFATWQDVEPPKLYSGDRLGVQQGARWVTAWSGGHTVVTGRKEFSLVMSHPGQKGPAWVVTRAGRNQRQRMFEADDVEVAHSAWGCSRAAGMDCRRSGPQDRCRWGLGVRGPEFGRSVASPKLCSGDRPVGKVRWWWVGA